MALSKAPVMDFGVLGFFTQDSFIGLTRLGPKGGHAGWDSQTKLNIWGC